MARHLLPLLKRFLWTILLIGICLEVSFLILGYRRYTHTGFAVHADPPNALIGHSGLGIQLNPGIYQVAVNEQLHFTATHRPDGTRLIPNGPGTPGNTLFLGCSFTYGFGVNDEATFTTLLQALNPDLTLTNVAVPGYGTVQSLLQLRDLLPRQEWEAVILVFATEHFMRNTLSPTWRAHLKTGYQQSSHHVDNLMQEARFPYRERCDQDIITAPWSDLYHHWPGRTWLASVNWLQTLVDHSRVNHQQELAVTTCLIREMADLCQRRGVPFGVVCLDASPRTKALQDSLPQLPWVDVGVDFTDPAWTNLPVDHHPSVAGHQRIATVIQPFLKRLRNGR